MVATNQVTLLHTLRTQIERIKELAPYAAAVPSGGEAIGGAGANDSGGWLGLALVAAERQDGAEATVLSIEVVRVVVLLVVLVVVGVAVVGVVVMFDLGRGGASRASILGH